MRWSKIASGTIGVAAMFKASAVFAEDTADLSLRLSIPISTPTAGSVLLSHAPLSGGPALVGPNYVVKQNFDGFYLRDTYFAGTGAVPPDTMGAVGPNHFAEFINGGFGVFNKDGTFVSGSG